MGRLRVSTRLSSLALHPDRCDACGRCVTACQAKAIRVSGGYLYIDTDRCDGCGACIEVCGRGAIERRAGARKQAAAARANATAVPHGASTAAQHTAEKPARVPVGAPGSSATGWTLLEAVAVCAAIVATLLAGHALAGSQVISVMPSEARAVARGVVAVVLDLVLVGVLAFLAGRRGSGVRVAFGLDRKVGAAEALSAAGLVLALLVATRVGSTLWGAFAQAVGWEPPSLGGLVSVFGAGWPGLVASVAAVVVVAPFVEELAFRGVVLTALASRTPWWLAIALTALVFAASHGVAWTLVPLFLLGLACGWLAWSRRSLWPAIALHALYNGVVIGAAFWLAR